MPIYATIFMIMTMSSIGLPTLNGFIGEFLILQGAFMANIWWAVAAGSGVVLGAAYMLWLYQRTMFGKVENPKNEKLLDMNLREVATFVPLIILAVWIGIYPSPFLRILSPTVNTVIARLNPAYPAVAAAAAAAAKQKDCDENKALTAFTTPPCGDAAATAPAGAAAGQPEAGSAPVAKPAAAGGAARSGAMETSSAGGRH
jgi:NADH-quinone oxidoreductase subunit M